MPKYWMISDRTVLKDQLGSDRAPLSFWTTDSDKLDAFSNWKSRTEADFRKDLIAASDKFPRIPEHLNEDQKHVTLFVHGFNNGWQAATLGYKNLCDQLYSGPDSLGICILFSWPSDGKVYGYYPDREDARKCAPDLAAVLNQFYTWLLKKQEDAATTSTRTNDKACKAKTSVIAHSMGNYVLQNAMQLTWTRQNQPLLTSLINQLLMVAADVDNDLFKSGEQFGKSDGDAIANLTYRITALYSGRDSVLGVSAGLKHFGKRRLGRSGLDRTQPLPDNVWDVDCSSFFPAAERDIHGAYFHHPGSLTLMRDILKGIDRGVLQTAGLTHA